MSKLYPLPHEPKLSEKEWYRELGQELDLKYGGHGGTSSFRAGLLLQAEQLIKKRDFSREDSARLDGIMQLVNATPSGDFRDARYRTIQLIKEGHPSEEEMRNFFAGQHNLTSRHFLESSLGGGSVMLRTYAGMDYSNSSELAPVDFYADYLSRLKMYDQIFDSSRWITTRDGRSMRWPNSDDVAQNAAVLAESTAISQGPNPTFGLISFPKASLWTTNQLLYSVQLANDSGVDLSRYFADIFAKRFARGVGASLVTTLLANADAGVTTASPSAIVESEVYDLVSSLDAAYACAPTAGWLMSLDTLISIYQIRTSGGAIPFIFETDANGRPLLLTKPVYICPSFPAISNSNQVAAFGDLSRFIVREAGGSFQVIVYRETYMTQHQLGTQAWHRLDGVWGATSASDKPIRCLVMHS